MPAEVHKVDPGFLPDFTPIDATQIAAQVGIQSVNFQEIPSYRTATFQDSTSESVVQFFSDRVSPTRLQVGRDLGLVVGRALRDEPIQGRIVVVPREHYLGNDSSRGSFISWYGANPAIATDRVPGSRPAEEATTTPYIQDLGTAIGITHSHSRDRILGRTEKWETQQLTGINTYIDTFLRPALDVSVYSMNLPAISLQTVDYYWYHPDVHHGIVPVNLSSNNTLVDKDGQLIGLTGLYHGSQYAPRIFAAARAAWGVWTRNQNMSDVAAFVQAYQQRVTPEITPVEASLWLHMIAVRGILNWHETQLVDPELAARQKALLAKLIKDNGSYFKPETT